MKKAMEEGLLIISAPVSYTHLALCYQENDIMLGLKYLNHLAQQRKMPLVICIALGTNFGGHNGCLLYTSHGRWMDLRSCLLIGTENCIKQSQEEMAKSVR